MNTEAAEFDYLIVGAGAAGMAFADTLLDETNCTLAIVDRRHRPGGHWNDAYPFVRLHQPSHFYGVNSQPLGSGGIDAQGMNQGLSELASGAEVLAYFDTVMRQHFLPSGRVRYWPMCEVDDDGTVTSLLSGDRRRIGARKIVNAAYLSPQIPATTPPQFEVAGGVRCIAPANLPGAARPGTAFVVIGAGKTGIDTCLWLLANGADPGRICWIMPRDSWMYDRGRIQPGSAGLASLVATLADEVEALAGATSLDDVFDRLEAKGNVLRLDPAVRPSMHHCATVTKSELAELRRISNIVRLGRVTQVDDGRITLERGVIDTAPGAIHVNCSARAFEYAGSPARPIFEDRHITLQFTRNCAPTFSAALVAHVEATRASDEEKNAICPVTPPPSDPVGWLRIMLTDLPAGARWFADPDIAAWLERSRLNILCGLGHLLQSDPSAAADFDRFMRHSEPAMANAARLLAESRTWTS